MDTWSKRVTAKVGESVKRNRNARGWSAEQLANEVREIGVPITRAVITDLENGRRSSISLPELLAISYVLQRPPLSLWLSELPDGTVEALPDSPRNQLDTALWFIGLSDLFQVQESTEPENWDEQVYLLAGHRIVRNPLRERGREKVDLRISDYLVRYIVIWQQMKDNGIWIRDGRIELPDDEPEQFLAMFAELLEAYELAKDAGFTIRSPLEILGLEAVPNEEKPLGETLKVLSKLSPELRQQLVAVLTQEPEV